VRDDAHFAVDMLDDCLAKRHPRVSVVATDPGILRVLEITALETMLPVHASLDEVR
jgi:hypothetical protein